MDTGFEPNTCWKCAAERVIYRYYPVMDFYMLCTHWNASFQISYISLDGEPKSFIYENPKKII